MNTLITCLLCCCLCGLLQAQPNIDSLTSVVEGKATDSLRLRACHELVLSLRASDSVAMEYYLEWGFLLADSSAHLPMKLKFVRTLLLYHQYERAESRYQEVLVQAVDMGNQKIEATCLFYLGYLHYLQSDYGAASIKFRKSLGLFEQLNMATNVASSFDYLARIQKHKGNYEAAIVLYQKVISISEKLGDMEQLATAYLNLGNVYSIQQVYRKARDWYQKALAIYQQLDNQKGIAHVATNIGILYFDQQDYKTSLDYYRQSLQLKKALGDMRGSANVLLNIGSVYEVQGNYTQALVHFEKSKQLYEQLNSPARLMTVLENTANIHLKKGNVKKARSSYKEVLALRQQQGDKRGIARCLHQLGQLYLSQYQEDSATYYFEASFAICKEYGYSKLLQDYLQETGTWYSTQGQLAQALDFYYEALQGAEEIQDSSRIASIYLSIATAYRSQHDVEKALDYQQKALQLYQAGQFRSGMAAASLALSELFYEAKQTPKALSYAFQALTKYQYLQDSCAFAPCLLAIGNAYSAVKQLDSATHYYEQATGFAQKCGTHQTLIDCYLKMGQIYQTSHQSKLAFKAYKQAFELAKTTQNREAIKTAAACLYPLYQQRGQLDKALVTFELFHANSDSLFNEQNTRSLVQKEMEYAYEKEKQIQLVGQQQKDQRQRWLNYSGMVIGLTLSCMAFAFYRNYQNKQKANLLLQDQNRAIRLQKKEIESQRDYIKDQTEELESSYEQLKSLDEMKRQLIGMIVHDLKNPLAFIAQATHQKVIRQRAQEMLQMVLSMLDTQKMEEATLPLKLQTLNVQHCLNQVYQQVVFLANQRNIQLLLQEGVPLGQHITADAEITERILVNLLTNAIKFSPLNGTIILQATDSPEQQECIRFSVRDQGEGITPEHLSALFTKFGQVEARKSGGVRATGLGLAFCKLATEAQSGTIGVHSTLGEGTTFWVDLPKGKVALAIEVAETAQFTTPPQDFSISSLSPKQHRQLRPYLQKLQEVEVYDYSFIRTVLDNIADSATTIVQWKEAVKSSLVYGNQEQYQKLVEC